MTTTTIPPSECAALKLAWTMFAHWREVPGTERERIAAIVKGYRRELFAAAKTDRLSKPKIKSLLRCARLAFEATKRQQSQLN
jgi:hypothetical protein